MGYRGGEGRSPVTVGDEARFGATPGPRVTVIQIEPNMDVCRVSRAVLVMNLIESRNLTDWMERINFPIYRWFSSKNLSHFIPSDSIVDISKSQ